MPLFITILILVFGLIGAGCNKVADINQPNNDIINASISNTNADVPIVREEPVKTEPEKIVVNNEQTHSIKIISVPFTSQAPFANWDMPYQEACEEASMIMIEDFSKGIKSQRIEPSEADSRILDLVKWEENKTYPIDLTAQEVVRVLFERFGIKARVAPYSANLIRQQINAGRPIILPAAGRLLGNPNFHQPGPLYHMLVVKGYEGDEFITNDPGTRRGENYRYHFSAFDKAAHDWNGGDVENGEQAIIILD